MISAAGGCGGEGAADDDDRNKAPEAARAAAAVELSVAAIIFMAVCGKEGIKEGTTFRGAEAAMDASILGE